MSLLFAFQFLHIPSNYCCLKVDESLDGWDFWIEEKLFIFIMSSLPFRNHFILFISVTNATLLHIDGLLVLLLRMTRPVRCDVLLLFCTGGQAGLRAVRAL